MESSSIELHGEVLVLAVNTSIAIKSILNGCDDEIINEISILLGDVFIELEKYNRERDMFYDQLQDKIEDNNQLVNQYNYEKSARISADNKAIEFEYKYNDIRFSIEDNVSSYDEMKEKLETKLNYYIRKDHVASENYYNLKNEFDKLMEDHHHLRTQYLSLIGNQVIYTDENESVMTESTTEVRSDPVPNNFTKNNQNKLKPKLADPTENVESDSYYNDDERAENHVFCPVPGGLEKSIGSCSNFSRIKKSAQHYVDNLMNQEMDFETELGDLPGTSSNQSVGSSIHSSNDRKIDHENPLYHYDDSLHVSKIVESDVDSSFEFIAAQSILEKEESIGNDKNVITEQRSGNKHDTDNQSLCASEEIFGNEEKTHDFKSNKEEHVCDLDFKRNLSFPQIPETAEATDHADLSLEAEPVFVEDCEDIKGLDTNESLKTQEIGGTQNDMEDVVGIGEKELEDIEFNVKFDENDGFEESASDFDKTALETVKTVADETNFDGPSVPGNVPEMVEDQKTKDLSGGSIGSTTSECDFRMEEDQKTRDSSIGTDAFSSSSMGDDHKDKDLNMGTSDFSAPGNVHKTEEDQEAKDMGTTGSISIGDVPKMEEGQKATDLNMWTTDSSAPGNVHKTEEDQEAKDMGTTGSISIGDVPEMEEGQKATDLNMRTSDSSVPGNITRMEEKQKTKGANGKSSLSEIIPGSEENLKTKEICESVSHEEVIQKTKDSSVESFEISSKSSDSAKPKIDSFSNNIETQSIKTSTSQSSLNNITPKFSAFSKSNSNRPSISRGKPPKPKGHKMPTRTLPKPPSNNVLLGDFGISLPSQVDTHKHVDTSKTLVPILIPPKIEMDSPLVTEIMKFHKTTTNYDISGDCATAIIQNDKSRQTEENSNKDNYDVKSQEAESLKPVKRTNVELSQFDDIRSEAEKILFENKNLRDSCNALTTINRELNQQMEAMNSENELINNRIQALQKDKKRMKTELRLREELITQARREKIELENKLLFMQDRYFTEYELVSVMESKNNYKKMFTELKNYISATDDTKKKTRASFSDTFKNIFRRAGKGKISKYGNLDNLFLDEVENYNVEMESIDINAVFPFNNDDIAEMPLTAVGTIVSDGLIRTSTGMKIVGASYFYDVKIVRDSKSNDNKSNKLIKLDEKLTDYKKTVIKSRVGIESCVSPHLWMSCSFKNSMETKISVIDVNNPNIPIVCFGISDSVSTLESIPGCTYLDISLTDNLLFDSSYTRNNPEKDYFPSESELLNLSLSQLINKLRTILPTVWIGCQNGNLKIFPSTSNYSLCLLELKLPTSITSIKYLCGCVFVGTSNSGLFCFERGENSQWSPNYKKITLSGTEIMAISIMACIGDSLLLVACKNKIYMVDCHRQMCYKSVEISKPGCEINCLAWSGDGVWVSFNYSTIICLYNTYNFSNVQEIDITKKIPNNIINSCPIKSDLTSLTYPTTLKIFGNMLWVGHSSGLIQGFRFDIPIKFFDYLTGEIDMHHVYKHTESVVLPRTFIPRINTNDPFILPIAYKSQVVGLNAVCNSDGNVDSTGRPKLDSIRVVSCGNGIRNANQVRDNYLSNNIALITWNWKLITKKE